jgi:hypothetical protein
MGHVRSVVANAIGTFVLPLLALILIVLRQHTWWRLSVALKIDKANGQGHAQKQYRNLPQAPPN